MNLINHIFLNHILESPPFTILKADRSGSMRFEGSRSDMKSRRACEDDFVIDFPTLPELRNYYELNLEIFDNPHSRSLHIYKEGIR
jgi:hypothetical protein